MAMEVELVYRAQDAAGRKDAAYIIQMMNSGGNNFQVLCKWGSWERYHNGTLQSKVLYVGSSQDTARREVWGAADKRLDRGYELQQQLSTIPVWLIAHADYATRYGRASSLSAARPPAPAPALVAVKPVAPETPVEPARTRHSRAGFLKL